MSEADLRAEFESRRPWLKLFGDWVTMAVIDGLTGRLGSSKDVDTFLQVPAVPRVKKTESFLEKLVRKPNPNPFHEVTDQVGVRFVVLLLKDIDFVGDVIKAGPWNWQKDRDFENDRLNNPDYFSYQSDHYVVRLRDSIIIHGSTIPTDTACEIQVRTILQHAYAQMAHGSVYKPNILLPHEKERRVRRALAKGSALIETTDDVFGEIKARLDSYDEAITRLLEEASRIYREITGEDASSQTQLGRLLAHTYRERLSGLTVTALRGWASQQAGFIAALPGKRSSSILYRNSIVILLGWLVNNFPTEVPKAWPLEGGLLEDLYLLLGLSPDSLAFG